MAIMWAQAIITNSNVLSHSDIQQEIRPLERLTKICLRKLETTLLSDNPRAPKAHLFSKICANNNAFYLRNTVVWLRGIKI